MDVDKQLKYVEDFFNFTLTRIPDLDKKKDLDRPLNPVKIRKDILTRYNELKGILDEDLWQTFSKRSIYILQALENLVANTDDNSDYDDSTDDESSDDSYDNELVSNDGQKTGSLGKKYSENNISKSRNTVENNTSVFDDHSTDSFELSINSDVEMSNVDDTNVDDINSNDDINSDQGENEQISKSNIEDNCLFNIKEANLISNKKYKGKLFIDKKENINDEINVKSTTSTPNEILKRKLQKKIFEHKAKRLKFNEDKSHRNKKREKMEKIPKKEQTDAPILTKKNDLPNQPQVKFNDNKTLIYSKIEFPLENKKKHKLKGLPRGKNFEQLLEMANKEKKKINELKMTDKEKAKNYKEKILWRKIMAKAEGVKIKDNEHMLRKSLNRKEFKKSKGKQRWKEREKMVDKKILEKQKKRNDNIRKKKELRKSKKIKKRQKK